MSRDHYTPFDSDNLKLPPELAAKAKRIGDKPASSVRARLSGPYVPAIPLGWITAAAKLPGRTVIVALALWRHARMSRTLTIPLSNRALVEWGIGYRGKCRGLSALEKAGLVRVERKTGASPKVTILGADADKAKLTETP